MSLGAKYNQEILEASMKMISQSKDYFISPDLLTYSLKNWGQATKYPITIDFISPHWMKLMTEYAISLSMLTSQDEENFSENPMEFIHKMKDVTQTFYSCQHSAIEMILLFCFLRTSEDEEAEPDHLRPFFNFCVENLTQISSQNYSVRQRDVFMAIIQNLSLILKQTPSFHSEVEELLIRYAIPNLSSEIGLEKYRALKLYFDYNYIQFKKEHLMEVAEKVHLLTQDHEIPVKVTAASTLYKLLKKPVLKEVFEPQLGKILQTYLELMNEVESEDLVCALEEIVAIFSNSIEPFAVELCEKLALGYWRLVQADEDDNDDFDETGVGAMSWVTTIRKIFSAVKDNPKLMIQLEKQWFKIFIHCTTPDALEAIDDTMACETMIMHHWDHVSEELWSLFPHLVKIIVGGEDEAEGGYGFEYLSCMIDYFRNLIRLGQDQLWVYKVGDTSYIDMIVNSIHRIIQISKNSYSNADSMLALRIVNALLENLPGRLDNYVPHFIKMITEEIIRENLTNHYIQMMIKCLFLCFHYDPKLTFSALNELNCIDSMAESCFGKMEQFKSIEDINIVVFGTVAIFKLSPCEIPETIKSRMATILDQLIKLMHKYVEEKNQNEEEEKEESEEEQDIDDYDSEPDDVYDDEYLFGDSELDLYTSPMSKIHSPLYFRDVLNQLQSTNPEMYEGLIALIPQDTQSDLQTIFVKCESFN
jgi:importin-7